MAQTTQSPDPQFVATLKGEISGMAFADASKYDGDKIKEEFPKCTRDHSLLEDERFMHNLMFMVRKREVCELRPDIEGFATKGTLKPEAEVSALKSWYACGDQADRDKIDDRLVARLKQQKRRFDELEATPALEWADRIGGPKTMELLKQWHKEVAGRQTEAENQTPDDHMRIGQLDQMRSSLNTKIFNMSRRMDIVGQDEVERASSMAELYLRQAGMLEYWAYKELLAHPSPAAVRGVRDFMGRGLSSLTPAGGISNDERSQTLRNNRLRALCLIQAMGEQLTSSEQTFFDQHAEEVEGRRAYFSPGYDWEDVLDRL